LLKTVKQAKTSSESAVHQKRCKRSKHHP